MRNTVRDPQEMEVFIENYAGHSIRKIAHYQYTKIAGTTKTHNSINIFSASTIKALFVSVFLPQGYPHTVSGDYLEYQIWDTVQAFASSMNGALATEAVLKGAGVGNEAASVLAVSLTWLVKDGLGMIGRIAFSFFKGTELDFDCKKWRLVADILNDVAFCIDLALPFFPGMFFACTCISSLFRCVVGVAGGATRTTIFQHQARRNNLADVSAKDGSQETLVNVLSILVSLILLPIVSGNQLMIWPLFGIFTFIHLYSNFRAVRSLNINSMNRKRAILNIRSWLKSSSVLSIPECNQMEPIFRSMTGRLHLGCSLLDLISYYQRFPSSVLFITKDYTILFDSSHNTGWISLCMAAENTARFHSLFDLEVLATGCNPLEKNFDIFISMLQEKGWNIDSHHFGFDEWSYEKKQDYYQTIDDTDFSDKYHFIKDD